MVEWNRTAFLSRTVDKESEMPIEMMEITMSAYQYQHQTVRPLSDEECESVTGGCFGIPVSDGHGGIIYVSPTIGRGPWLPTSTKPTFPTGGPSGPFPA
jgi:hypothetical protein